LHELRGCQTGYTSRYAFTSSRAVESGVPKTAVSLKLLTTLVTKDFTVVSPDYYAYDAEFLEI